MNARNKIRDYEKQVSDYYDVATGLYSTFWSDHFHAAIFKGDEDVETALFNTHKMFLKDSKVKKGDKVLDLGCGVGAFSRFIASNVECDVFGVSISNFQIKRARQKTKNKNINFKKFDVMKIDKIGETFDVVFMIDVAGHLPNKAKALRKISKILKPGGTFVSTEWLHSDNLNAFEKEVLIDPFNSYWRFPNMISMKTHMSNLKKSGFKIIKAEDISEKVKKTWDIFYDVTLETLKSATLAKSFTYIDNPAILKNPKKYLQIAKSQFYANILAKIAFEEGCFRYGYFVSEKI